MRAGRQSSSRPAASGGFTLVEALVAIAILGATLVLVSSTYTVGWSALGQINGEAEALALARARLQAIGLEREMREGAESGADSGYQWRTDVTRHSSPSARDARERLSAWHVTVQVDWRSFSGAVRTIELVTVKVGEPRR